MSNPLRWFRDVVIENPLLWRRIASGSAYSWTNLALGAYGFVMVSASLLRFLAWRACWGEIRALPPDMRPVAARFTFNFCDAGADGIPAGSAERFLADAQTLALYAGLLVFLWIALGQARLLLFARRRPALSDELRVLPLSPAQVAFAEHDWLLAKASLMIALPALSLFLPQRLLLGRMSYGFSAMLGDLPKDMTEAIGVLAWSASDLLNPILLGVTAHAILLGWLLHRSALGIRVVGWGGIPSRWRVTWLMVLAIWVVDISMRLTPLFYGAASSSNLSHPERLALALLKLALIYGCVEFGLDSAAKLEARIADDGRAGR